MARSLLAGMTDYTIQRLEDIKPDLLEWAVELEKVNHKLLDIVNELRASGYWETVYHEFTGLIAYSISFFDTSKEEIKDILSDLDTEVSLHHCSRLKTIGTTACKLNSDFGRVWHREYPDAQKDYENPEFKKVDTLYCEGRDMAVDLMDLVNAAERLNDFVGKKIKSESTPERLNDIVDLKPNFFGIGINFNALIKKLFAKKA